MRLLGALLLGVTAALGGHARHVLDVRHGRLLLTPGGGPLVPKLPRQNLRRSWTA